MSKEIYIPRVLHGTDGKEFNESELLSFKNKVIIVLAEPGAGKSCLLDSLSEQLGIRKSVANIFIHSNPQQCSSLAIDGFDELVKIDSSTVVKALVMANQPSVERIILSSRSSEWYEGYTQHCRDIFGEEPLLVYLKQFNEQEQKALFLYHYPGQNVEKFLEDAASIELSPLLSNPLFLKLFSKSYVENNQCFENRYSAFKLAIEGLAKENNRGYSYDRNILPASKKIELVEDVFTKLMLSGSEGVSLSDSTSNRFYPHIVTLNSDKNINQILSTQFFLPSDGIEQHRPVHRIVAEYCAGNYLAKKLTSTTNPLSLSKILSIIAPNNIMRNDLRGLCAWMAVLSQNPHIQEVLIDLDPYAILYNGDSALLLPVSKRKLLLKLKELNQKDPHFHENMMRNIRISGFLTDELLDELRNLLSLDNSEGSLHILLLELLRDSPLVEKLANEIQCIIYNYLVYGSNYVRVLAGKCLSRISNYNYRDTWDYLIEVGDEISLETVADIMTNLPKGSFQLIDYIKFLKVCSKLYLADHSRTKVIGERFFIKRFIQELSLNLVIPLLDGLSDNLFCSCKKNNGYKYRIGISNIISMLLDRYFELPQETWEPERIWKWIKKLYFQNSTTKEESLSVKILSENDELRRNIIRIAFENIFECKSINQVENFKFEWTSHSGLHFQFQDYKYIIDFVFDTDNIKLWLCFIARHYFYGNKKEFNRLHQYMRMQALKKRDFLHVWYMNKIKHQKKQRKVINRKINYIKINRQLIESEENLQALFTFSLIILQEPNKVIDKFRNDLLSRNALYRCLDYIQPHIPSLSKLAELHCKSKILGVELILYAACLEVLKRDGSLNSVSVELLTALRTNLSTYWLGIDSIDRELLKEEVDRCLFSTNPIDAKNFLREYIEPQLACVGCKRAQVNYLNDDETFTFCLKTLPLEWLKKFPNMNFLAQEELLQLAIQFGNREDLKGIVLQYSENLLNISPALEDEESQFKRIFWFALAFYLLDEKYEVFWEELIKYDYSFSILKEHLGLYSYYPKWIKLSAVKTELILKTFIGKFYVSIMSSQPDSEEIYYFFVELIGRLETNYEDDIVPVVDRLLQNDSYLDLHDVLKSVKFHYLLNLQIQNLQIPKIEQIVYFLDKNEIISVENLRAVILEELRNYQKDLDGHDITTKSIFYHGKINIQNRVDENTATQRIADRLRLRLENQQVNLMREGYMKDNNRCDLVFSKLINGKRKILPVEVKGQWHSELYSAFDSQLDRLYAIHPDADGQGIYLVLWFGVDEKVANRKNHLINNAKELYLEIQKHMSEELKKRLDVFVLDLSVD